MDKILYRLCRHNVGIMDSWHPYPATAIAETLGISVHKVRYHLRKLKKEGLVDLFQEGGMSEDGKVFCYWGWTITEKAHSTAEYKKAYEEERKLYEECFGYDIGELNEHIEEEQM